MKEERGEWREKARREGISPHSVFTLHSLLSTVVRLEPAVHFCWRPGRAWALMTRRRSGAGALLFGALYTILLLAIRRSPHLVMHILLGWFPPVTAIAIVLRTAAGVSGSPGKPRTRHSGTRRRALDQLRRNGIPESYLSRPPQAIRRWGEVEALRAWWDRTEPRFRSYRDGYPPDWQWRRRAVMDRDHGRCRHCGVIPDPAHVHHLIWLADGGNHALSNLILLCPDCHAREHDDPRLYAAARRRRA